MAATRVQDRPRLVPCQGAARRDPGAPAGNCRHRQIDRRALRLLELGRGDGTRSAVGPVRTGHAGCRFALAWARRAGGHRRLRQVEPDRGDRRDGSHGEGVRRVLRGRRAKRVRERSAPGDPRRKRRRGRRGPQRRRRRAHDPIYPPPLRRKRGRAACAAHRTAVHVRRTPAVPRSSAPSARRRWMRRTSRASRCSTCDRSALHRRRASRR